MKENHDLPADETQLRVENELKKLNLEMEYGAMFGSDLTSPDLPLEVESQWLDYISAFENQYKDATQITVYSFIGQPDFKLFDLLTADEVEKELTRLFNIMAENGIQLDFLADYPIETMYRFLTEEFFEKPMDNMRIPGMMHGFIYEEYHPNHEYDLKNNVEDFFRCIMNLKSDFKSYFLSPVMATDKDSEMVDREVYEMRIENFRKQFKKLKIKHLEILDVDLKDVSEDAKFAGIVFNLDYEGILKGSNKLEQTKGRGYMNFVYTDYWLISRIVFAGF
jgi:hypothetical protein